jgi:hypothetical protein
MTLPTVEGKTIFFLKKRPFLVKNSVPNFKRLIMLLDSSTLKTFGQNVTFAKAMLL